MKFVLHCLLPLRCLLPLLCLIQLSCFAQQVPALTDKPSHSAIDSSSFLSAGSPDGISDKALKVLNARYSLLNKLVERHTEKMLKRMEKKELGLQRQVHGRDSAKAAALFRGTETKYQQLLAGTNPMSHSQSIAAGLSTDNAQLPANPLKEYLPGVDSMQTALRFLNQPGVKGLGGGQLQKLQALNQQLQLLQGQLQNADDIQTYIRQRGQQLKDQLSQFNVGKQLQGINAEAYYYQARLTEYKNILNDPEKWQQVILSAVRQLPLFQHFWQQNSYFAQLFPVSPNAGTPLALAGLQTRDQLQQDLQQKFGISTFNIDEGGGGGGGAAYLQNQMQTAQTQLDAMKDKLSALGGNGGGMTMPDFKPNGQRVKSFMQRLEYGFNIQNNSNTALLPAISTVGLSIGYKLSDKATIGLGGTYLLGLGNGLNHIHFSNQGLGWRTYADIKAKGSIWITAGWESTFMQQFSGMQDIPHLDLWQQSALIGLSKKYKIGKKVNNLQVLYDLMAARAVPRGQPFKFRIGWGL